METEKIRNLNEEELKQRGRQAAEQLFRLRFQMKLGQNEGVKKLRDLRKDIARIKTIEREREIQSGGSVQARTEEPVKTAKAVAAPGKTKPAKPARKGRR